MILRKKLTKDQRICTRPARMRPSVMCPVEASVEKIIAPSDSAPRARIGEKSIIPTLVKEKRLNQLRKGSQRLATKRPAGDWSIWGIHVRSILIRQTNEYTDITELHV